MTITRRPFKAEDVVSLSHARDTATPEQLEEWAEAHERMKPNMVFICEGKIVASGGLGILWPGVAEAWVDISVDAPGRAIVEVKRQLHAWIEEHHLWRVQSVVPDSWVAGNRFLEWLGMSFEGTLKKMSPDGLDMNIWAVTNG